MNYTIDSLKKENGLHYSQCYASQNDCEIDVNNVNEYIDLLNKTRSTIEPKAGDIVRYTTEHGDYYHMANIEKIDDSAAYICENGNLWIYKNNEEIRVQVGCGGSFKYIPLNGMKYVGKDINTFQDWGACGSRANGAIYFKAEVSVWEYTEQQNFISEITGKALTTKEYSKYYVSYKNKLNSDERYHYKDSMKMKAWTNDIEFQAWLRTFRAEIFYGNHNAVVWAWKNIEHHVSPTEFDSLKDCINDTFLMNGSIRVCKRVYDDENHTVHTYYVWYWNEPDRDFYERNSDQNKAIDSYKVDWRTNKANEYALREFSLGVVNPIDLSKMKKER